jgi:hypothetical protein
MSVCKYRNTGFEQSLANRRTMKTVPGHGVVNKRKVVARHGNAPSVGADGTSFTNPAVAKPSAGQQAGMYYARQANRAGR